MTPRPIGYYVHHHGFGHRTRAEAIASASSRRVVLLGTDLGETGIDLPDDRLMPCRFDGRDDAPSRPAALHYAPLDHAGIRARVARIASWIAQERPSLMVVDVSVEVAMLARLASVPTIVVRLNGQRDDAAHLEAFRGAAALLAPFHASLETAGTPVWVREKTHYLPGITKKPGSEPSQAERILVMFGRGGDPGDPERLAEAAHACPQWQWRVIGPFPAPESLPPNLTLAGWSSEPEREIARAGIVVGAAGDGLVGAVLAAGRPFICIPEHRPFGEQRATAAGLAATKAALTLPEWPEAASWPCLIEQALRLPSSARRALHDPDGAIRAADWLEQLSDSLTSELQTE
ncbi:MAG: glycosyltransferase [Novosphingobium sp.]|nr:glycosyltransferase [Novosphingobium sp.]